MLECLRELTDKKYDTYFFLPSEDDNILIQGNDYKDPGEQIGGNSIGDCYHIILFQQGEEGETTSLDKFDAILGAPLEYISEMLPNGWFGIISRKTTTSNVFVEDTFDKLKETC
jgi:hypothetical protein